MAAPSTGFGAPGETRSYWVTKGWNHLARHGAAEPSSKSSLRALSREALPWAHTCAEPGEEKTGEQDKTRKSRDPKHGPRKTFCRDLHFLLIHKKLRAFPRGQKLSVQGGRQRPGRPCRLCWGKAGGRGALPFPRDKLQQKPPWAEARTKTGRSRAGSAGRGGRVSQGTAPCQQPDPQLQPRGGPRASRPPHAPSFCSWGLCQWSSLKEGLFLQIHPISKAP